MKVDIPLLLLILREMLVLFACWVWCWQWVCHIWCLLCVGMFPLFPLCWEFFIINRCWSLSKASSVSIDIILWVLSFILFVWCIIFIDLWILYQPCIPRINPTWSWCMIFLMHCCIRFPHILLRILAFMFIKDIGL